MKWYAYLCAHIIVLCVFVYVYPHHTVKAQSFSSGQGGLSLETTPSFPAPHTQTVVSVNDYGINAVGAHIFWYINGAVQKSNADARSLSVDSGNLGQKTSVRAVIVRADGSQVSADTTIVPTVVDLVLEADSYVPSFYQGRALPGRTSHIRAIAVVHDGDALPAGAYTYRWTLGEDVLFGGPVRGKSVVSFPMPLFSSELLVEVINPQGRIVARNTRTLRGVQPELYFYKWSPLTGLYQHALTDTVTLMEPETTIYSESYFTNTALSPETTALQWSMNGSPVSGDVATPQAITLNRDTVGGSQIGLHAVTNDLIPQILDGGFTLKKAY